MTDDIVTQLRERIAGGGETRRLLGIAADEIQRLRAAGDALVESLDLSRDDIRAAVAAWQEARR